MQLKSFKKIVKFLIKEQVLNKPYKGMRFLGLKHHLMLEAKIDDAKKKFPNVSKYVDEFSEEKYQKYIFWIARQLNFNFTPEYNEGSKSFFVRRIKTAIDSFEKGIKTGWVVNKDIESYESVTDLEESTENLPQYSKTELRTQAKKSAKLIYKDDRFTIIKPESLEASCYYGFGTKWCISATQSQNYFEDYTERGISFYFIMDKKPTEQSYAKVAIAVDPVKKDAEFYDASDNPIDIEDMFDYYPQELIKVLTPFVSKLKKLEQIIEEIEEEIKPLNGKELKKYLYKFYNSYEQNYSSEDSKNHSIIMQSIIKNTALDKLPILYFPDGAGNASLNNVGVMSDFIDRLESENLSIQEIINMAQISHASYGTDENWYFSDPYLKYLEENEDKISLEDAKLLYKAVINPRLKSPDLFRDVGVNSYLRHLLPSLGISYSKNDKSGKDEFILLKLYSRSTIEREFIEKFAQAIKENDKKTLSRLEKDHRHHSSIEIEAIYNVANLLLNGKINADILKPLEN